MIEILTQFVLPVITLMGGWFAKSYRDKQKKENDVLKNVQQAIDILRESISFQDDTLKRTRSMLERMEKKYDDKCSSVRKAYTCKVPSEECPVLINESKIKNIHECAECEQCPNNPNKHDKGTSTN